LEQARSPLERESSTTERRIGSKKVSWIESRPGVRQTSVCRSLRSGRQTEVCRTLQTSFRQLNRAEQGLRFVHSLLVFAFRHRISDDPGARLHARLSVAHYYRANRDARIQIVGIVRIQNSPCVNAAPHRLELSDYFHGTNLWRAGYSARGKA